MWFKIINGINERQVEDNDLNYLNLRFDLHIAIYMIELLKSKINFEILDNKLIIQDNKENILSDDDFYFWWQITRYQELYNEEFEIIKKMKGVDQTIAKLKNSIQNIKEKDDTKKIKKIDETETKIAKLTNYMMKENPIVKQKLTALSNFRNTYHNRESIDKLLNSIRLYLINNE
jgi:hypothetical protein